MKAVKLFLPLAAILLAACTHELQTRTIALEDSVPAENIDASCDVSCSFEYVTGGVSQEIMDKINGSIIANHILFEESEGRTDVEAACKLWVEQMLNSYSDDGEEVDEEDAWMYDFEYSRSGEFAGACKSRHLQTYTGSDYEYTGGAHGYTGIGHDVFDMTTGEIVTEEDLFAEGYEENVAELLAASLEEYLAENEEDPESMFSLPEPNGNFAVSEEGITWTYNPYEIAPYSMGIFDLLVSWDDLKPYLK
jgi:Protein of unknown function (DUF3298).